MTRLVDIFRRAERAYVPDAGTSMLLSSFGTPDREKILPTWQNTTLAYANSGVVFGVILARVMLFSEAEFKFQNLADKSLFGNADLTLLEEPWPGGTTGELLARMEQDVSLAGNSFIRKVNDNLLARLRPDWVTIVSHEFEDDLGRTHREVVGYSYDPMGFAGEPAFYDVSEVAHWSPIPDPLAEFRGMSWLTPVLREVDADQGLTDYKRAYLENAATPNMVVKYSRTIGDAKLTRLKNQMQARFAGPGNAFKTMVLDEGADPMILGANFAQMEYTAVQQAGENRICVAGGVPALVVGIQAGMEHAKVASYSEAMRRFGDMYGRPSWRSAASCLSKFITVPSDARLWFDLSGVAALRQGDKEQADTMLVLAEAANYLMMSGFTPDTIKLALAAGDINLLDHSGLTSVQMQVPGTTPPKEKP